ncbi:MAG: hypothetical protein EP320_15745 [Rhodobacteraceae bacterium]|jgi:hypothetical protein|uniref:DUF5666 domain-containing protein n=1 Tax=Thioclava marina TaxID=1915077 RepID=A0ABX3MJY0_9RHOB|nr:MULTISPECIES: hypothetical protein [Thioclava]TNE94035.1 MAG: hypothetical protein EP337_01900 [Paracoccaceae bacterium]MBD3803065.1 hypothetical protein [Thioclava sp.]OOY11551.1 hypothetical protein BMG00_10575 [Thioclava marina]OOY27380.1 hypothetical protein BMI90_12240 [Thioclava sp. L04-15]TNF11072.1 MAG: hypothetical protein EP320_15745 [Paracoccaceae bacterium]
MKRTILFTTALTAALGLASLSPALAQGPNGSGGGKGAGGGAGVSAQSGDVLQLKTQTRTRTQTQTQNRYQIRDGELGLGTVSAYRDQLRDAVRIRNSWVTDTIETVEE